MTPQVAAVFETLGSPPHPARYCVWSEPATSAPTALIVYVHPFGEEMNKSRRMAALQSRAFACVGAAVLQVDLLGCGDSAGDTGDATWAAWVDDVVAAARSVVGRFQSKWPGRDVPPLWLWGLRAGCLLAAEAAQRLATPCHFLFWQPALAGKSVLQQFLRLQSMGAAIGKTGASAKESARTALAAGRSANVAGYTLHPALASGFERARLTPAAHPGHVLWMDVSTTATTEIPPAAQAARAAWEDAGHELRAVAVIGPSFWQTTDIEEAPALISATLAGWTACAAASPLVRSVSRAAA